MNRNPVCWFEIYVQDIERAKVFYETVLDVKLEKLDTPSMDDPAFVMWAFPGQEEKAGAAGALVKMEGMPSGGNSTVIYFSCADCAVEAERARTSGGTVTCEKMPIGEHGFFALATDPDGNTFGLHSLK